MKRGESLYLEVEKLRLLGLPEDASPEEQRDALDLRCHHETDSHLNDYLFQLQGEARGVYFMCANPDGDRERDGDHICWFPKERVQYLKMHFLAGGHQSEDPPYLFYTARNYHLQRRNFLTAWQKMVRERLKRKEKEGLQQMKLKLVKP